MSPFLFRLIVAIYVLAGVPALIVAKHGFGAWLMADFILGSLVALPVLLIAWVAAGLRQRP